MRLALERRREEGGGGYCRALIWLSYAPLNTSLFYSSHACARLLVLSFFTELHKFCNPATPPTLVIFFYFINVILIYYKISLTVVTCSSKILFWHSNRHERAIYSPLISNKAHNVCSPLSILCHVDQHEEWMHPPPPPPPPPLTPLPRGSTRGMHAHPVVHSLDYPLLTGIHSSHRPLTGAVSTPQWTLKIEASAPHLITCLLLFMPLNIPHL